MSRQPGFAVLLEAIEKLALEKAGTASQASDAFHAGKCVGKIDGVNDVILSMYYIAEKLNADDYKPKKEEPDAARRGVTGRRG
jgi:hypothetical protein